MGAGKLDLAGYVRPRLLRDRDDGDRRVALRRRALRRRGLPLVAAPGRPPHRLRPRRAQDGRAAPPDLRPDARAEVGHGDGRLRQLGRNVQQLRRPSGRGQDRPRRHLCARLPAAARGGARGNRAAPGADQGGRSAGVRDASGRSVSLGGIPGYVGTKGADGETTVVVERESIVEAALYCRDELGFNVLADLTPTDYLGWGQRGVAGYYGTAGGRDINTPFPGSQGLERLPPPKPKRFAVNYHLLSLGPD